MRTDRRFRRATVVTGSKTVAMPYLTRPAQLADAEAIGWVLRRSMAVDEGRELPTEVGDDVIRQWERRVASDDDWVIVRCAEDGRVIGVCHGRSAFEIDGDDIRLLPGVAHLTNLFVDPDEWDRGHGRALLQEAHGLMRERGFGNAQLWTGVDSQRARHLYESEGWRATGLERDAAWGRDLLYIRSL